MRGATPKLLDGSTFESLSPEELQQAEEDVRQHELEMQPNHEIQFAGIIPIYIFVIRVHMHCLHLLKIVPHTIFPFNLQDILPI